MNSHNWILRCVVESGLIPFMQTELNLYFHLPKFWLQTYKQILFRMAEQIKDSNSTSVLTLCTSVDVYHNNAELQSQVYCMILQTTTRY